MKGQEAVIAIVLILMMVIALAALAYTWFSGIFNQLMQAAGFAVTKTTGSMSMRFNVENAVYTGPPNSFVYVTIRNTGNEKFDATKTSLYINDMPQTLNDYSCSIDCDCTGLEQGCIATFNMTYASLPPQSFVKVVIENGLESSKEIAMP